MNHYDVVIIGAGLLGCFAARNLARYNWNIAVFEKNSDVCTEVSKANTAIIYPGYDNKPGSLKARFCTQAMADYEKLCIDLGVRFKRNGSLMVAFGPRGERVLAEKYQQGLKNEVKHIHLLHTPEILKMEPLMNKSVTRGLYAETTATVNPWELGIAAYENAAANGVVFHFEKKVTAIQYNDGRYELSAGGHTYFTKAVINCAGLSGSEVSELINTPKFRLDFSIADYLLLDDSCEGHVNHIIMHEPEEKGRGATIVPTVDGNLLLGPAKIQTDNNTHFHTTREGCETVGKISKFVFPDLPLDSVIRSFATIRPAISMVDCKGNETGQRVHDLLIYETENPGFINLAGIRTPGLTCCEEIGRYVLHMLLDCLGNPGKNAEFRSTREAPVRFKSLSFDEQVSLAKTNPAYAKIVCRCRKVTEGEIRAAIHKIPGNVTPDGIKRRTGTNMGRCQGGFCTQRIMELIAEEQKTWKKESY